MNNSLERNSIVKRPEIIREQSPERFLGLFAELTGMRLVNQLETAMPVPSLADRAGVRGAVIVGSSTNPSSTPKDLDTFLFLDGFSTHWVDAYIEELRSNFDRTFSLRTREIDWNKPLWLQFEQGRLDLLGVLASDKQVDSLYSEAIKRAPQNPLVFAYDLVSAQRIQTLVQQLRGGS